MERTKITQKAINITVKEFKKQLLAALKKNGDGSFSSTHEILGKLSEEFNEVEQEVHKNNKLNLKSELYNVAVVTVFGAACINSETLDS